MSSVPSNVAAHATATSAPDHPVWFHGSRGENFSSLLGVWHRGKRSVQDIVDQIQIKIASPGGIAEGVQVPTLRTSSALTPSTGQGPQKRAKPQVATNPKFPKSPNVPSGAPHPRNPAGVPGMVGGEIDGNPQGAMRGPQSPIMGSGTVTSAENRAVIDLSTGVIERTNAAPSRAADWGTMASPMGPIVVDSGTSPSLGGLPEPQVRKNLFAAGPITPIVDQPDAENRRVLALTPDPHGHLGPAREAVALIQQTLSGTRQNPTVVELSPTPMSGSRRFPSLVEESPALGAYPNPPSGSRLNPTIIEESPTQIEEDECDQWFPLAVEQWNDDEEEEIGVLERHELHHSPISVASSPAPPEPMSGTRDRPMLVEASPPPHYITVEDSPAPQFIAVEKSPVATSGVKNRPCLVVESPEPTQDRAGTTSPVPMSGTKDRPSLVDDSPAMPKVNNLCWGGENQVEGGSATLPKKIGLSPHKYISYGGPPTAQLGGGIQRLQRDRSLFLLPIRELDHLWCFMSHHSILWWTIPHPHRRDRMLLVMFPLRLHPATARWLTSSTCKESRTWFGHLVVGVQGGDIPLVGGGQRLLLRAPHPRLALRGGPLVPQWQGGLLGGAVVGHLLLVEGGVHPFDVLGAPLLHGGRKTYSTPVAVPGVWCTTKRASNL